MSKARDRVKHPSEKALNNECAVRGLPCPNRQEKTLPTKRSMKMATFKYSLKYWGVHRSRALLSGSVELYSMHPGNNLSPGKW